MTVSADQRQLQQWLVQTPDTESVAPFKPYPGIQKLALCFDINKLQDALREVLARAEFKGNLTDGFGVIALNRRPGTGGDTATDLSGRYYLRVTGSYEEQAREDLVDESAYNEFNPLCAGTYFETVYQELTRRFRIGRVSILSKRQYNCNSWHRDPEPRLHIPIISNPGSLFIVNHHVTHLPADGSVYFTDTRSYHTALNGGETRRVHLVVALPCPPTW